MDGWNDPSDPEVTAPRPVTATPERTGRGRHRAETGRRRFSRPTLAVGAAAVASLAVLLGVGVLLVPTGSEQRPPTAADGTAGGLPGTVAIPTADELPPTSPTSPTAGPATTTPTAGPATTTPPSATPSRTVTPSPTPGRTRAASRGATRTAAPSRSATTAATAVTGTMAQQVVALVNQERAKAGCGALTVNADLTEAAQLHSEDQAAHQKMSHEGSDGSDFVERAERAGYEYAIGENVAMGYETAEAVMQGWMNSPGHRANILNCDAEAIGVGVATGGGRLYWTQDFGSRA